MPHPFPFYLYHSRDGHMIESRGQFRHDGRTIQTLYCVVICCENISSIFITLQAIKVGPKLEVSHNKSYFQIKGEGLGLLKGV